jgi:hypothetical protein
MALKSYSVEGKTYSDEGCFIKIAPENPVLWTGMKGVSAKSRKNLNQMLKRSMTTGLGSPFFVIPNLFRDLGSWF